MLLLCLGAANVWRGVLALQIAPRFEGGIMRLDLHLMGVLYLGWGLLFLAATLWAHRSARLWPALFIFALTYQLFIWSVAWRGERTLYRQQILPRNLLLTVVFLLTIGWLSYRETRAATLSLPRRNR